MIGTTTNIFVGWDFELPIEPITIFTNGWFDPDIISTDNFDVFFSNWNDPTNVQGIFSNGWFDGVQLLDVSLGLEPLQLTFSQQIPEIIIFNEIDVNVSLNYLLLTFSQQLLPVINIFESVPEWESYDFMPTGYFMRSTSAYDNERELYALLEMEQFNLYGSDLDYYCISYNMQANAIWGEDTNRRFERQYHAKCMLELPKENEFWTQFGIEGIDTFVIFINKMHFNRVTGGTGYYPLNGGYNPKIGDLLRLVYNNHYYEITNVNHTDEMFLQFKHSWSLTVRPYKHEYISN
jgi:hypothetical protein